jgi:phytoene dehydrogenase-like protein
MNDVIVIGGGHNGLAAACYLARGGYSVTVLEANGWIGGMTEARPLVPAAPKHLLNPGAIDLVWDATPVGRDLNLAQYGLRIIDHNPAWAWLGTNGESLLLMRDVGRTIAEIERFSTQDARTYREYAEITSKFQDIRGSSSKGSMLLAAAHGLADRRVRRLLGAAAMTPAADLIDSTFVSEPVRGMIASMVSIYGSITVDGSGIFFLAATAALHRYGVGRPVGGMQAIPDSLSRCLQAYGGSVRVNSPVVEILLSNSRVRGVRLANGEEVLARAVVAAIPPQVTARLLAGNHIPNLAALEHAPANSVGLGSLIIVMALSGKLDLSAHQRARTDGVDLRKPTLYCGTFEQVLDAEATARAGRVVQNPPWAGTILSATDPTVAPDGQDNLYLYAPAPVRPGTCWAEVEPAAEKELICAAEKVMPGISHLEIGRWVQTPEVLERRLGAKNGCIFHVDMTSFTRLGPFRPARGWGKHLTDLPGLVLSGAGTQPGGGVTGIPGKLAAQELMRRLKKES